VINSDLLNEEAAYDREESNLSERRDVWFLSSYSLEMIDQSAGAMVERIHLALMSG